VNGRIGAMGENTQPLGSSVGGCAKCPDLAPSLRGLPPVNLAARLFRRLDRSMRARIILPTAVLFTATLAVMVAFAVTFYSDDMERGQHEKAELFAGMVSNGITSTMLQGTPDEIPAVLQVIASHRPDLTSASLIKPNGVVARSSRKDLIGTRPWGSEISRYERPTVITSPAGDSNEYAIIHPIPNEEQCASCHGGRSQVNGWLDLRFTQKAVTVQRVRLVHTLLTSAGLALLCLLTITWWLVGREAIGPLQRLVNTMKRAEAGDLAVRADEGRADELGIASRGFDATLTALRRSQTELEAFYRERMVRADRFAAVGELATGLAHEIKNPLAGLSGALELLSEDLSQSPTQAEMVGEMRHQVQRLTNTMESLLSFARPPKTKLRTTNVNLTLEKVLFLVRQQQRRSANVEITPDFAIDLPPVLADPSQLEQVFLNLCLNACQAMDGKGKLNIRTFADEDRVAVEIADDGPGIPAEVRPHLFKPFFTTKREGNGLGLAISARIVAEHGGHIGYRCPQEGGTIFSITLQQARAAGERATEHAA
jgi:signal transduction histidine kinase